MDRQLTTAGLSTLIQPLPITNDQQAAFEKSSLIREKWCKRSIKDWLLSVSLSDSQSTTQSSPSETFSQDFFCENIVLKNSNQRQCLQIDKKGKEKFVKVTQEAFKLSVFVAWNIYNAMGQLGPRFKYMRVEFLTWWHLLA